jgi:hypothetical protein
MNHLCPLKDQSSPEAGDFELQSGRDAQEDFIFLCGRVRNMLDIKEKDRKDTMGATHYMVGAPCPGIQGLGFRVEAFHGRSTLPWGDYESLDLMNVANKAKRSHTRRWHSPLLRPSADVDQLS